MVELNPADAVSVRPTTGEVPPSGTLTAVFVKATAKVDEGAVTLSATAVVFVTPPPVAVIVTVADPAVAVPDAAKVTELDPAPGAAKLAGEKLAVTPAGSPVAERAIAELNPPASATVRPSGAVPDGEK